MYFHEPEASEINPESEISSHITLTSIISGLFRARHLHCSLAGQTLYQTQSGKGSGQT